MPQSRVACGNGQSEARHLDEFGSDTVNEGVEVPWRCSSNTSERLLLPQSRHLAQVEAAEPDRTGCAPSR